MIIFTFPLFNSIFYFSIITRRSSKGRLKFYRLTSVPLTNRSGERIIGVRTSTKYLHWAIISFHFIFLRQFHSSVELGRIINSLKDLSLFYQIINLIYLIYFLWYIIECIPVDVSLGDFDLNKQRQLAIICLFWTSFVLKTKCLCLYFYCQFLVPSKNK